jgi:hypothetical protein
VTHLFGKEPTQVPAEHASPLVQVEPSSQGVPSGLVVYSQVKPMGGGCSTQVPAPRHWPGGGQMIGSVPAQAPDWQTSTWVHVSPSLQGVPSGEGGSLQRPVPGSHVPASRHGPEGLQTTPVPPMQANVPPAVTPHASPWVQALLSLQGAPAAFCGLEHAPVRTSQTPTLWHWLSAVHTTAFEPWQAPEEHASVCVQAFPSLQGVPSGRGWGTQAPLTGLHALVLHASSKGEQSTGGRLSTQLPFARSQTLTPLQRLPSSQSPSAVQPQAGSGWD